MHYLCNNFCPSCLDVELQLPKLLPHATYDTSHQGEVTLTDITITDHTLAAELSNELKEQVATSYRLVAVVIPVVLGGNEKHGVLTDYIFTNKTKKKVLSSYVINYKAITQVDIVEEDNGTVRIRLGDDVMVYQVGETFNCKGESFVGEDFDKVLGKIVTTTDYPLSFDWGCELLGSQISFCQALQDVECELAAVGGDVCTLSSTYSSQRCPITVTIVNMTGKFRDMFPFLAETIRTESFEAEVIVREHTTGITFPCLTP